MGDKTNVTAALAAVDEDHYTLRPDGSLVTQSTAASAIVETLERLDVRAGTRVLEIGTGSGFSSALLSELVGPAGSVVSVDVVAELTTRTRELHASQGRTNVTLVTGDGALGAPGKGNFDRVVAWTTPSLLPRAWVEQAADAVIVTPVELAPSVRSVAILRARVDAERGPEGVELFAGRYVEMHDEELEQWLVPPRGVDASVRSDDGLESWISAPWAGRDKEAACRLLKALADEGTTRAGVLEAGESAVDLTAYLYARRPEEISVVGLGGPLWGVGYADPEGVAVFTVADAGSALHGGSPGALERLRAWVADWRAAGHPGYADLNPVLTRESEGWRVRAELAGG